MWLHVNTCVFVCIWHWYSIILFSSQCLALSFIEWKSGLFFSRDALPVSERLYGEWLNKRKKKLNLISLQRFEGISNRDKESLSAFWKSSISFVQFNHAQSLFQINSLSHSLEFMLRLPLLALALPNLCVCGGGGGNPCAKGFQLSELDYMFLLSGAFMYRLLQPWIFSRVQISDHLRFSHSFNFQFLTHRGIRLDIPTWRNEAMVCRGKGELIIHLYLLRTLVNCWTSCFTALFHQHFFPNSMSLGSFFRFGDVRPTGSTNQPFKKGFKTDSWRRQVLQVCGILVLQSV